MRISDWGIGVSRRYLKPYIGSHSLSIHEDCSNPYGRDLFITFLGLMFYLVTEWR